MGIWISGSQHLFFLHMGFESLDWGFESVNLNSLTGIWIRISSWGIRIAFVSLHFLECGFESLCEGFESPSSVCTFWNVNSNRYVRDSNRLRQFALFGIWIRIAMWGIEIAFVSLHFLECGFKLLYEGFELSSSNLLEKLQNWRVNWRIRIA